MSELLQKLLIHVARRCLSSKLEVEIYQLCVGLDLVFLSWILPLHRPVNMRNCLVTANLLEGRVEYMLELLISPEFPAFS